MNNIFKVGFTYTIEHAVTKEYLVDIEVIDIRDNTLYTIVHTLKDIDAFGVKRKKGDKGHTEWDLDMANRFVHKDRLWKIMKTRRTINDHFNNDLFEV